MAGAGFENQTGPSYISSSYAENILSDVRPIKLKLEALRSINVLLDEFLYKILGTAGSLSTDNLKAGLNKLLPTTLGKESVLEAEVELKAYWERNTPHQPVKEEFDLQWSFELLRLKCEGYTTMNDADEDAEAIKRVNGKMGIATGLSPPHTSLLAPASLYLTAILEHVCQHVLSNVSLVTSRDSSRTVATVQDLFTALCEDASLYNTFKAMDVYEQIDSLSKMQHPRRSKSLSKSSVNGRASPARTASPIRDASLSRLRVSSESTRPTIASALGQQPASNSNEKSRVRLFGRSSSDHERSEIPDPRLSSDTLNGNSQEIMDEAAVQEFDELMRSSTTMKVSLTPDRLKSMEVYKQDRKRHKVQEGDPTQITSAESKRAGSVRQLHPVDSIQEDDEPMSNTTNTTTASSIINTSSTFQNVIVPRTRLTSLSTSPMSSPSIPVSARVRSVTISTPLAKKRSIGQVHPPPLPSSTVFPVKRNNTIENVPSMQNGRPARTRKVARNRESIDLDEVMGGDDDEFDMEPMTPRRRDPSKPYISQSARDLIDFLEEGPPDELRPPNMNASMLSFESTKTTKSGRLRRVMSKLALGGSSEKLSGRMSSSTEVSSRMSRTSRRSPSNSSLASSPPSSYALAMTPKKPMPTVIVATPPPPLASFSSMTSISTDNSSPPSIPASDPPSNPPSNASSLSNGATRPVQPRRISITRKAAPTWEDENTEQVIIVPPATPKSETHRSKPSPLDAFPPVPETVNIDGRILPNGHVEVIAEMRARRESRTPSPLDTVQFRRSSLAPAEFPPSQSQSAPATPNSSSETPPRPRYSPSPEPVYATESDARGEKKFPEERAQEQQLPEETLEVRVEEESRGDDAAGPGPELAPVAVAVPEAKTDLPAFTSDDARDMRRLLSVATTADECRLLVDMFLARSGFPLSTSGELTALSGTEAQAAASELQDYNEDLERSLVSLLLGEEAHNDIEIPSLSSVLDVSSPALAQLSA